MDQLNKYLPWWQKAEQQYPQSRYVRQVRIIDFATFSEKVYGQDDPFRVFGEVKKKSSLK